MHQGVEILIFPHTMHRDGRHWEDALEFKPERWLPRGEEDTASPRHGGGTAGAYLPFSSGARNCVRRLGSGPYGLGSTCVTPVLITK
jgi:cytochrome P450